MSVRAYLYIYIYIERERGREREREKERGREKKIKTKKRAVAKSIYSGPYELQSMLTIVLEDGHRLLCREFLDCGVLVEGSM